MTYYEWVQYIEELKNKTITDDIINKINKSNLEYPIDIMNRLVDHFLNVIYGKLNDIDDNLITNLKNIKTPQELTLMINSIINTINDTKKLLTIKYLDQDLINYIENSMIKYTDNYKDTIRNYYKGINSSEYSIILNNMKFMEEK